MHMRQAILGVVTVMGVTLASAATAHAGRLVYMGPDPACHFGSHPQGQQLAANAVRWAGNGNDPRILLVKASCGSGGLTMLQNAGFTQITDISESQFASQTLGNFDVIYITYSSDASQYTSSAAAVFRFANMGGGLVVEGNADSLAWAPLGNAIGLTGDGSQMTSIVDSLHPVMAGLTNAGFANWNTTSHSNFTTPGAGQFLTLAIDGNRIANIIVHEGIIRADTAPVAGWQGMLGLAFALLGWGLYRQRRAA
jgi:hypothetical protein